MKPSSSYWSWRGGLPPLGLGGGCLGFAVGEVRSFEALVGVVVLEELGVLVADFCLFFLLY